ncbi:amino acid transporter [Mesorhizobium sp. 113-1-2]|uniref:LysE family translocator n=1 Tax=Mesorhizobium sp. 113-1-2 TaxID=2744515 RepID=UPI0019280BC0|nr:LysE family translocator [Mesorhizobium sp. 113-1-2]BCG72402.1 amino acid transporter [Mesorhizobium sp. 113-1-2]
MHITTVLAFVAVTFVAVATPGPDVILALVNGSRFGMRRAFAGMVGVLISDLILIVAVAAGLGVLLAASEFWFSVLKYVGAAYLAWLGIKMLRSRETLASMAQRTQSDPERSALAIGLRSMVVAITNPKAYLFFSALLPQFVDPAQPQLQQFAVLTLAFSVTELAIMVGYALVGARGVRLIRSRYAHLLERVCGGALLASAFSLALARRGSN